MAGRILIVYATRNGSTAGIAEAVGKELVSAGFSVKIAEVKTVTSPAGYNAIVLGAPFYMGTVVREMVSFIRRHRDILAAVPVAVFAVGLAPKNPDPKPLEKARKALHDAIAPLAPEAEVIFAGNLDPARLSFFQRKITELIKSPVGDFRDWDAIAAWATALPGALKLR